MSKNKMPLVITILFFIVVVAIVLAYIGLSHNNPNAANTINSIKTSNVLKNISNSFNTNYPISLNVLDNAFGGSWHVYNSENITHNLSFGMQSVYIENITNASGYDIAIAVLNLTNASIATSGFNLLSSSSEVSGLNEFNAGSMSNGRPYFISPVKITRNTTVNYTSFGTLYKNKIVSVLLPISNSSSIIQSMPKVEKLFENISESYHLNRVTSYNISSKLLYNVTGYNWSSVNTTGNFLIPKNSSYKTNLYMFTSNTLGYNLYEENIIFPNVVNATKFYNNITATLIIQNQNNIIYYAYALNDQLPYSIVTVRNASYVASYGVDNNTIFATSLTNVNNATNITQYDKYTILTSLLNYMEGNITESNFKNIVKSINITTLSSNTLKNSTVIQNSNVIK